MVNKGDYIKVFENPIMPFDKPFLQGRVIKKEDGNIFISVGGFPVGFEEKHPNISVVVTGEATLPIRRAHKKKFKDVRIIAGGKIADIRSGKKSLGAWAVQELISNNWETQDRFNKYEEAFSYAERLKEDLLRKQKSKKKLRRWGQFWE